MSVDKGRLRSWLEELERIERPSASEGERRAAEWLVERFGELGAEARIEAEPAHGTYWWPLGIGAALGALGGILGLRGRRLLGGALAAAAAAGMASDFPPGKRLLRRLLPRRTTYNVVCELGPADAERTVVVIAHHDAAHSGLVFHPEIPNIADRLGMIERTDTSPPLMAPVIGGPVLAALGALTGRRLLAKLGVFLGLGSAAAMTEIGLRNVVPGANDNGTAVVSLLALAEQLIERAAREPARDPALGRLGGVLQRGDQGLRRAPLPGAAPREHLLPLPRVDRLAPPAGAARRGLPEDARVPAALARPDGRPRRGARHRRSSPTCACAAAPTASSRSAAGYETAVICSCTDLKQPANYHWWHDLAENVDFDTVADGIRLSEAAIRRLDERWL